MVICPESFYQEHLKGKSPQEIMTIIRGLKRSIGQLKREMEHPDYSKRKRLITPGDGAYIHCFREYLDRAKQAYVEAGGEYTPSAAERKAAEFEENLPYIERMEFSIGGFFNGYERRVYTVEGDWVHCAIEYTSAFNPEEPEDWTKEEFLEALRHLHLGEWRKKYDTKRYGITVVDGTQWDLAIYYTNGRRAIQISGDNAYPFNFSRLLEIFEVEYKV